ncbi:kinesin-domain-containing protein [Hysterangium stoloniferum]|nr:kinesin-domain-containing protein [Hysterangium stoloniferum]
MAAKVKVAARLRPFINTEPSDDTVIVSPEENTISVSNLRSANERFVFPFASCYDQAATQEEIFETDVKPLVDHVFGGLVCTVFAYGVTSSGKTHTIQGTAAEPGIIPRVVKALVHKKALMENGSISLSVSYMEIYKDEAYDLLVARENAPKLPIREDLTGKVVVANLTERPISSFQDFDQIYSVACKSRSVGATNLNHASSRSHAVLAITVTRLDVEGHRALMGKINLVDLAGSENNKLTGNDPSRMAESSAINKSLTVLGQVVHALNTNATRIPYRDSKLTRILQDALGGSSIGLLICNLAPGMKFRQDTLNTLNFASRTKQIENKLMIHEKDTRPPPKTHFSAQAPAVIVSRPPLQPRANPGQLRMSMGGANHQNLAIPTLKGFGFNGGRNSIGGKGYQISSTTANADGSRREGGNFSFDIYNIKVDAVSQISRTVQQEVDRRLAERDKQAEAERREREREEEEQRNAVMRKHDELNKLLAKVLRRAEKEKTKENQPPPVQEADREGELASEQKKTISPKECKRLARAYVSLGRDYLMSKNPDHNAALKLWQQAETYAPSNHRLKKRQVIWSKRILVV